MADVFDTSWNSAKVLISIAEKKKKNVIGKLSHQQLKMLTIIA